jgi:hypothetical protein
MQQAVVVQPLSRSSQAQTRTSTPVLRRNRQKSGKTVGGGLNMQENRRFENAGGLFRKNQRPTPRPDPLGKRSCNAGPAVRKAHVGGLGTPLSRLVTQP